MKVTWNFIMMLIKLLMAVPIFIFLFGCTTSETRWSMSTVSIKTVPKVTPVAIFDRLDEEQTHAFRKSREVVIQSVMGVKVYDLFWADDLQLDYVFLRSVDDGYHEVVKVKKIGFSRIRVEKGTHNDKPFESVSILDE